MNGADVIIIGGGFAGLRAAVALADAGARVTVLEGRIGLGGRARSFIDPVTGEVVDNGQHLFLAGYPETLRFLDRLGTREHLLFQSWLNVCFVRPGGKKSRLLCPPLPAPLHLFFGLLTLSGLSLQDKVGARRVFDAVAPPPDFIRRRRIGPKGRFADLESENKSGGGVARLNRNGGEALPALDQETVEQWLIRLKQSDRIRQAFWDPLTIATLNEDPARASGLGLARVLQRLIFSGSGAARLGMATVGLTDLYGSAARRIVEEKGGEIRLNCPVSALRMEGSSVAAVETAEGTCWTGEAVVSALPPWALSQILPPGDPRVAADPALSGLSRFLPSPIISINLWFEEPITSALFVGFIGTRIQWLFNKEAILARAGIPAHYVTLILSAAHPFIDWPKDALVGMALEELRACFPKARKVGLIRSQVVREREATVSLGPGMERFRPGPETSFSNLFLAGDWTATGLPATIESAVLSGRLCAEAVLKRL